MKQAVDYIEINVPAKPEYVGVVRLTASGVSNRLGYSYDEIEDIKVAVSEACTNAVDHAYKNNENGEITVGFGIYQDCLEIMVADHGKSFNLDEIYEKLGPVDKNTPLDQVSEGGLGLFLMETLMDNVRITGESGVVVLMTKFIRKNGVEDNGKKYSTTEKQ